MKKSIFTSILVICLLTLPAFAATTAQQNTADALNSLQLFKGTDTGYALDDQLQRSDGITLLVRLLGKDADATRGNYTHSFSDVAQWLDPYVAYAYSNGLTKGISESEYGSSLKMDRAQFLTMVLRALGYKDSGDAADFTWDKPYELAKTCGLIDSTDATASFTRGDAIEIFWKVFDAKLKGQDVKFVNTLIGQGVFTQSAYDSAAKIQKNGKPAGSITGGGSSSGGSSSSSSGSSSGGGSTSSGGSSTTGGGSSSGGSSSMPAEAESMTYEDYCEMTGEEQGRFQKSFDSVESFFKWLAKAMAESSENEVDISDDGVIDLGND